tara:strand:- start:39020 stop:39571 length:552 start_codon:yes stop_codon:yes gene_type:complete
MYTNFNDFLEKKHPEYLDEGVGSWLGTQADKLGGAMAKGAGRVANAAVSGLGAGAMAGARRAGNVLMHGQGKNELQQMANAMHTAIASGDRGKVVQAWKPVKQHYQNLGRNSTSQPNMGQPAPQQPPPAQPPVQPPPAQPPVQQQRNLAVPVDNPQQPVQPTSWEEPNNRGNRWHDYRRRWQQ